MQIEKVNSTYIEKHDVISRFLRDQLNERERNEFEIYILEHPEIISLIEEERLVQQAFKEHQYLLRENTGNQRMPGERKQINYLNKLLPGAALLLVGAFVLLIFPIGLRGPALHSLQPPIVLERNRGQDSNVITASGRPIVQLKIDIGPPELFDEKTFNVDLIHQASGATIFETSGLKQDQDGWLNLAISSQLEALSGVHEVRVTLNDNQGQVVSYQINFIVD